MKIVVIGDGKVGHMLATQLSEAKHSVVIVEKSVEKLQRALNAIDINGVEGNGVDYEIQTEAGVGDSDLVIACTSSDEINMLSCLIAGKLGAKNTIARVRNHIYYKQMELLKTDLRLSLAINPDLALAQEIFRILLFPTASKVEPFAKGRAELVEIRLEESKNIVGMSLIEIYKKFKSDILICAVERGNDIYVPSGDFVLSYGDILHVMAAHNDIKKFSKHIGRYKSKIKNAMICGGGRSAYYLAEMLINSGVDVKIVERDAKRAYELSSELPKAGIICGNAADQGLLLEEGLEKAEAFVSLTGTDEENIVMSMYASTHKVQTVVTKINNEILFELAYGLNLKSVVSPKITTANVIAGYVGAMQNSYDNDNIEAIYRLLDGRLQAIEFTISENSKYLNIPLKDMKLEKDTIIGCIVRKRKVIIPHGDDIVKPHDSVIIMSKKQDIQSFKDIMLG
jgi:K+ transport systems, NAD-binding component